MSFHDAGRQAWLVESMRDKLATRLRWKRWEETHNGITSKIRPLRWGGSVKFSSGVSVVKTPGAYEVFHPDGSWDSTHAGPDVEFAAADRALRLHRAGEAPSVPRPSKSERAAAEAREWRTWEEWQGGVAAKIATMKANEPVLRMPSGVTIQRSADGYEVTGPDGDHSSHESGPDAASAALILHNQTKHGRLR